MKKILILFMGLILGCNLASAKSVSCWEETSLTQSPTSSQMQTSLGSTVPTKVSTLLHASAADHYYSYNSQHGGTYFSGGTFYANLGNISEPTNTTSTIRDSNMFFWNRDVNSFYYYYFIGAHYIHTYCIVDEGSSGGGGGATGSVNFIIKATS